MQFHFCSKLETTLLFLNMSNEPFSAFEVYDRIWKQLGNDSFLGRCKRLYKEMRILQRPFQKVPKGMIQVKDFKEMCANYKEYIPDLVCMLDYIVRVTFRALLGEQSANYYNLYVRHLKPESSITKAVVEALAASRSQYRDSTEQKTTRAILYTTFNQRQVDVIVEEIQQAVQNIEKQNGEAACSDARGEQTCNQVGANDTSNDGEPSGNGEHACEPRLNCARRCKR